MSESILQFQSVCRESFAFLIADFGFRETSCPNGTSNLFTVEFTNGDVSLRIIGESWGRTARAVYLLPEGVSVPFRVLEPDWQSRNSSKTKKLDQSNKQSQDQQIRNLANRLRERDHDILIRDYVRLREAAARWQRILSTRQWQ